jgi:hypothetical protein
MIEGLKAQARRREPMGTYSTDALYRVVEVYKSFIKGKTVAVIGTEQPWVEAIALEWGAAKVVTIEYAPVKSELANLIAITPSEYESLMKREKNELFDTIFSYSSLEHDGLGRYTDPLNPYGDFQTMVKLTCMLKPGGLLILNLPSQDVDQTLWNLHRVYGPIRWPYVMRHFHFVELFGSFEGNPPNEADDKQPIIVLQNKIGCLSE